MTLQLNNVRNLSRLEKENKTIKNRKKNTIIRDIKNLFEHKKKDYQKPVKVSNFLSNYCVEYERNKTLSVKRWP